MKKTLLIIILGSQFLFLTGCWGAKEIQNQTYVTSVGLDYAKGEFTVYIQALNFASVAKQDGGSSLQQSAPIFIGKAKGKTIQAALNKLEQKTAMAFYYGHIETILLSEKVIKEKMKSVIDFVGQNPYLRYNCWLFGANQDLKEVLTSDSFFNYSSLYTIIHNPKIVSKSNFFIPIEKYNKFISSYYQPVGSYIIPLLEMNNSHYTENGKKKNIAIIRGGFVISRQQYKGKVTKEDLVGLKWFSKSAKGSFLTLLEQNASLILQIPRKKVVVIEGDKPAYHIQVNVNAILVQNEDDLSIKKIKKEAEKIIKNDLLRTIEKGEEMKTDLLNMSEEAYRFYLKQWDVGIINSISKESIKKIEVKINIVESINYKR